MQRYSYTLVTIFSQFLQTNGHFAILFVKKLDVFFWYDLWEHTLHKMVERSVWNFSNCSISICYTSSDQRCLWGSASRQERRTQLDRAVLQPLLRLRLRCEKNAEHVCLSLSFCSRPPRTRQTHILHQKWTGTKVKWKIPVKTASSSQNISATFSNF